MGSPVRVLATASLAAGLLAACSFDPGGGAAGGDGGPPGGDPDGGPCPDAIHAELAVGGVTSAAGGEPFVTVLIGDSVRLSAAGSCAASGALEFDWAIAGDDSIEGTAAPDLASEVVDVYPILPGDYTVTLTVGDGTSTADPIEVLAIRAIGWQVSTQMLDVRDLAASPGTVWLAANDGAFRLPLGNLLGAADVVNDLAEGDDDIPNDLSATVDGPDALVWFGHKPNDSLVWQVDVDSGRVTAIDFTANFQASEVNDIGRAASGVVIATRDGVSAAPDNQTFEAPLLDANTFVLSRGPSGTWAGGTRLYRLPAGTEFDLFGVEDDKIRALADRDGAVWAGSDDQGVAVFDPDADSVTALYKVADGLPSNKIRALAVDAGGDVWVASDKGVARFKSDREVWVGMEKESGLDNATDVAAVVAVGSGDARRLIAGTRRGVAVLSLP
jgi:hypothetical protein